MVLLMNTVLLTRWPEFIVSIALCFTKLFSRLSINSDTLEPGYRLGLRNTDRVRAWIQKFTKPKPFCLDNSASQHKTRVLCHFYGQVSLLSVKSDIKPLLIAGPVKAAH